ncbi:MAG TPA: ABC transporter substrate-binding protein [Acetobacteraceae bacterium]|nr:ABC transporter substrate-binding protein [Acetobacteraceae bacterium]
MIITRREALALGIGGALGGFAQARAATEMPGVTKTSVKIGNTMPYSGPASSYSNIGKTEAAYFKMINDQGGIHGRMIDFISLDDSYSPPKTVEQVRRLVEQDHVAFLFQDLGTPCNSAIVDYCNHNKIPQLFVGSGASKWSDYKRWPWTIGWQPSYRTEAQIYTKQMLAEVTNPKLGLLYQNDDFGKDYPLGVRDVLGDRWDKIVTASLSYETTDPTIESQIDSLKASGANVILVAAIPKFAAQSIRRVASLSWKPRFYLTNVSISVAGVMRPAGVENGVGIISTAYLKDPTDPAWDNDPGMKEWRAFSAKYMPGFDISDAQLVFGYGITRTMVQVLRQCGNDLSRENVMRQSENLHDLDVGVLLPGIKISTSPTDHRPIKAMQLVRWSGKTWERSGSLLEGV